MVGSCSRSAINLKAIGLTALPEYPPIEALYIPSVGSISTSIKLLIVLIAATPSAPPLIAAKALSLISVTFGVSLAINGKSVFSFTILQYFSTN